MVDLILLRATRERCQQAHVIKTQQLEANHIAERRGRTSRESHPACNSFPPGLLILRRKLLQASTLNGASAGRTLWNP